MQIRLVIPIVATFIFGGFSQNLFAQTPVAPATGDQKVSFILLQVNDVYEITPVSGEGGLARLATLKKQLMAENPNTYMILAGDLFSPSALGTAKVNGVRLSGKQMVDSFNHVGLDFATLGNHEFDLKGEEVNQRLQESKTKWIVSNATDSQGKLFPNTVTNHILTVTDRDQEIAKVGLFGVLLNSNPKDYVKYSDAFTTATQQVAELDPQVDMVVAITHLTVNQDRQLASQQPKVDLILGGHEHENMAVEVGAGFPKIYKADANARSAYIHRVTYHLDTKKIDIESTLKRLTADIPDDPQVAQVVSNWVKIAYDGFRKDGFEPEMVVAEVPIALDGLEGSVRNRPTELAKLLAETMRLVLPNTELAFFNGGSIRIDDVLPPGKLTQYDVIRILPFGGLTVGVEIKGSLLKQVLDAGRANVGSGGYLQTAGVAFVDNNWLINDQPLDVNRVYRAAVNDFLLTGKEGGLGFLTRTHPDLKVLIDGPDLRQAFIAEMKKRYNSAPVPAPVPAMPSAAAECDSDDDDDE
jgi:5'-nucleotidase